MALEPGGDRVLTLTVRPSGPPATVATQPYLAEPALAEPALAEPAVAEPALAEPCATGHALPIPIGPWIELKLPDSVAAPGSFSGLHLVDAGSRSERLEGILRGWRAAERAMRAMPLGSPAWLAAEAAFDEHRAAFHRLAGEPLKR